MCGIAGIVDLSGRGGIPPGALDRMLGSLQHRGPDQLGSLQRPAVEMAAARLSILDVAQGRQPMANAQETVWTVFNGELFEHPKLRAQLQARGHILRTRSDTELLPHLWEEYGEGIFEQLRGQFAFAIWDSRRNVVILARDRMGICPLFWTVREFKDGPMAGAQLLLFASEVKALLASGLAAAAVDLTGLNHVFSFFAQPGPETCFQGIHSVLPGQYIHVPLTGRPFDGIHPRTYWKIDFPDQGEEIDPPEHEVVDRFEALFVDAVSSRLRADVPVVSYLSGGVDSGLVAAVASKVLGRPIPTFTADVTASGFSEANAARTTAASIGSSQTIVPFDPPDATALYPDLIRAAETPVIDAAAAASLKLARAVHASKYKVVLTGEGADEALAGYPWFKTFKLLKLLDVGGLPVASALRRLLLKGMRLPLPSSATTRRTLELVGGPNPWLDIYGLMSLSKMRFYREELRETIAQQSPFETLEMDSARIAKWHPFNRALYTGMRIMLPGHLLSSKGDRPGMASSVENRYPFLDEKLIAFLSQLHPRWKLRGFLRDKYIERLVASRWLPREVAWRRKTMFRAPLEVVQTSPGRRETWMQQVLSPESLRKTGLFNVRAVEYGRSQLAAMPRGLNRTATELGLMAVAATQLWHHIYVGGNLADVPTFAPARP
jgi:asparagine synthase (glutamine-hydrolysing)